MKKILALMLLLSASPFMALNTQAGEGEVKIVQMQLASQLDAAGNRG